LVIIIAYGQLEKEEALKYKPNVVKVDENNKLI